jgi:short-subunit dehydrogenase
MTLYRASPGDGIAWITGASTGIGRRLALDLARRGYTVAATARDQHNLESLVGEAERAGGRITAFLCDVTDEKQMERTVDRIEKELGPIALAILNAGAYSPTYGGRLETDNFVNMFRLNVFGAVFGLVPLVDRMRHRGFGQVVLMGSVTAYCGLPSAAAYGASKAALNNLAQSLKYDFDKLNIRIQIANPGFVDTPLTAKARFNMPALMPVEKASERLVHGIENGGFEIVFPRRLAWLLKAGTFLPQALFHRIIRKLTGWDQRRFGLERKKSAKREKHSFGQRQ